MTLTELRYIIALSETGHFGKAADKSAVSQPTLSVAVKKLEEELGLALFERGKQAVTLTPAGAGIVDQARRVLEQVRTLEHMAIAGKEPLGSRLAIGAIHTVGPYLFPNCIPALRKIAPDMPLYVEENYTAELRRKLVAGDLDAIIVALPFTESDVVTQTLYQEPFMVLLPHGHPLSKLKQIPTDALLDESVLLLGDGHCFRDQVLNCCPGLSERVNKSKTQFQSVVEGSSLETLKHMVASNLGISVLPESATNLAGYGSQSLLTRPLAAPCAHREVALAWRASFPRHQAIDALSKSIHGSLKTGKPVSA